MKKISKNRVSLVVGMGTEGGHKLPMLGVKFDDDAAVYKVATFHSDDRAAWFCDVIGENWSAGWISVKERLPEINQIVLTYCNDRGAEYKVLRRAFSDLYKAAGLGDGLYWESIDYMTEYPDEFGNGEVTHWMPLPEPPEVK